MKTIKAEELSDALWQAGLVPRWDNTGGNVGTLHVGPFVEWVDPGDGYPVRAYAAVLGPGDWYAGFLFPEDLAVGPDYWDPTVVLPGDTDESLYQELTVRAPVDVTLGDLVVMIRDLVYQAESRWSNGGLTIHRDMKEATE